MKRRNIDSAKLRRTLKRNRVSDAAYGSSLVYLKLLMVWSFVILADFVLDLRFEYLWPFWLMLRSIYDSFRYQGMTFSFFFICITFTSDMICFIFIPVQWIFFIASTYVWIQYVWHADRGICLPTTTLWLLFIYFEAAMRLKELKPPPFTLDLCRPFAAHCIGYPVVTLGFGVKSYVSYRLRLRRQCEVRRENRALTLLLQSAIPVCGGGDDATSVDKQRKAGDHCPAATVDETMTTASGAANGCVVQNGGAALVCLSGSSSSTVVNAAGGFQLVPKVAAKSKAKSGANGSVIPKSRGKRANGTLSAHHVNSGSHVGGSGGGGNTEHNNRDHGRAKNVDAADASAVVKNGPAVDCPVTVGSVVKMAIERCQLWIRWLLGAAGSTLVRPFRSIVHRGANVVACIPEERKQRQKQQALVSEEAMEERSGSPVVVVSHNNRMVADEVQLEPTESVPTCLTTTHGLHNRRNRKRGGNSSTTGVRGISSAVSPASGGSGGSGGSRADRSPTTVVATVDRALEAELDQLQTELRRSKSKEYELRMQVQQAVSLEKTLREEVASVKYENEQLQSRVQSMLRSRAHERTSLQNMEKLLADSQKARERFERMFNQERRNLKQIEETARLQAAQRTECDFCKRRRDVERDAKQLRKDLANRESCIKELEEEVKSLREYKEANERESLANVVAAMESKNTHLEESLSSETRIKLDLFSALGEAHRQQEIMEGALKRKEQEVERLTRRVKELTKAMGSCTPVAPNCTQGSCMGAAYSPPPRESPTLYDRRVIGATCMNVAGGGAAYAHGYVCNTVPGPFVFDSSVCGGSAGGGSGSTGSATYRGAPMMRNGISGSPIDGNAGLIDRQAMYSPVLPQRQQPQRK